MEIKLPSFFVLSLSSHLMENFFNTIFNFNEFIFVYVVNIRFICDGEICLLTSFLPSLLTYLDGQGGGGSWKLHNFHGRQMCIVPKKRRPADTQYLLTLWLEVKCPESYSAFLDSYFFNILKCLFRIFRDTHFWNHT